MPRKVQTGAVLGFPTLREVQTGAVSRFPVPRGDSNGLPCTTKFNACAPPPPNGSPRNPDIIVYAQVKEMVVIVVSPSVTSTWAVTASGVA